MVRIAAATISAGVTATYICMGSDDQPVDGGYSGAIVVDEDYVLDLSDALSLQDAAPLVCAGIILYSALSHRNAGPGKQITVLRRGIVTWREFKPLPLRPF